MKKHELEKIIASYYLSDKVTVIVSDVTKYDDSRVEIRRADDGLLIWRAWDFEEGFMEDLDKNLKPFSIPA
ncbi:MULTISPECIES: DUF905 family protein [Enterobacterales]|jgi:hypothetical protein|uniref:DUF905 family protein n=1 Tax=Enterobacterales TaxID=91347 RepID=UPI0003BE6EDD|nr:MULTISPECIES: DUF905 family protein [Enterobacteriaceae]EFA0779462.1 DUF905 domain-containing protein [Escherichia coli]EFF9667429.1 DUF905 domain-containing protein [Escherichia coli]EKJ3355962.1 DUF905 family protein [Escherichia coli]ELS5398462.1 DUF905 family protein [Escherichia coli]ESN47283.1 hypothetical protein L363_05124 [Klebsiella pneumoniae MGH 17]